MILVERYCKVFVLCSVFLMCTPLVFRLHSSCSTADDDEEEDEASPLNRTENAWRMQASSSKEQEVTLPLESKLGSSGMRDLHVEVQEAPT